MTGKNYLASVIVAARVDPEVARIIRERWGNLGKLLDEMFKNEVANSINRKTRHLSKEEKKAEFRGRRFTLPKRKRYTPRGRE